MMDSCAHRSDSAVYQLVDSLMSYLHDPNTPQPLTLTQIPFVEGRCFFHEEKSL